MRFAEDRRPDLRLVAVTALAALLRGAQLGAESLWLDELITVDFVTRWSGLTLPLQLPRVQPHPPVYYLVLDAWISVAGASDVALRVPSAVFGVAAVALLYRLGHRLHDEWTATLAALLLACSSFHVGFGQEARMYSLLTALSIGSVLALLRVRELPTRRRFLTYGVVSILLVYTHVFGLFVVVAEAVWVLALSRRGEPTREVLRAFVPVGTATTPLAVVGVLRASALDSLSYIEPPTAPYVLKTVSSYVGYGHGTRLSIHAVVVPLFVGLAAYGIFGPLRTAWRERGAARVDGGRASVPVSSLLTLSWFVVPLSGLLAVSYLVTPVLLPRYAIVVSPALFLLVARGVTTVSHRHLRVGLAVLVVASTLPSLAVYYTTDDHAQWNEAGAAIEEHAQPDDLVVVSDSIATRGVDRYVDRPVRVAGVTTTDSGTGKEPTPPDEISALVAGEDRVWLVFSHANPSDRSRVRSIVAENRTRTHHWTYEGVEVYLYERTPSR